jgi:hypothetical protein
VTSASLRTGAPQSFGTQVHSKFEKKQDEANTDGDELTYK